MAASKLTNEEKLKRLIYINNLDGKYLTGGPDKRFSFINTKKDLIDEYLKNSSVNFIQAVLTANKDKLVPFRSTLLYLLACALKSDNITDEVKPQITNTLLTICKSDEEFFNFIKYVVSLKVNSKLPPTVYKAIRKFYTNKSAEELAKSFAKSTSYHKWSHKDLIKLGHVKSDTPVKDLVITYILFKKTTENDDKEQQHILNILTKSDALRKTKDHKVAVPIIEELKATIFQIEPSLRKSAEVWNAVLPNMSISEILDSLPKLYKLGFLKKDTPTQVLISETLINPEKVKTSGIHPIEVFIHMKDFEKGGKPLDPKLLDHLVNDKKLTEEELKQIKAPKEARSPAIVQNLQKCMKLSYSNCPPSCKRYLVTIDVTSKMELPCLNKKNVTALEAATAFALALSRIEKDVIVAVYKQSEITVVQLDKRAQFYENVQKLKENKTDYLVPSAPMEWAMSQKKNIDIFVNFVHHHEYNAAIPKDVRDKVIKPVEALHRYRKKVHLQNTKLVTLCLTSPHLTFADGSPNILDIAGLDFGVPKVLEAFCKGNFS